MGRIATCIAAESTCKVFEREQISKGKRSLEKGHATHGCLALKSQLLSGK